MPSKIRIKWTKVLTPGLKEEFTQEMSAKTILNRTGLLKTGSSGVINLFPLKKLKLFTQKYTKLSLDKL